MSARHVFMFLTLVISSWAAMPAQAQRGYRGRRAPRRVVIVQPRPVVVVQPRPVVVRQRPVIIRERPVVRRRTVIVRDRRY